MNDAVLLPAGTVTVGGTVAAAVLLLETPTAVPPEGAGPVSVTVPVALAPALTVPGFTVRERTAGPELDPEAACLTASSTRVIGFSPQPMRYKKETPNKSRAPPRANCVFITSPCSRYDRGRSGHVKSHPA